MSHILAQQCCCSPTRALFLPLLTCYSLVVAGGSTNTCFLWLVEQGQDIYIDVGAIAMLRSCLFLTSTPTLLRVLGGPPLACDVNGGGGCGRESLAGFLCDALNNTGTTWGVLCSKPCSLGFFGDPSSNGGCTACPKGKFGNSTGRGQNEACELCDGGTYNSGIGTVGASSCSPCQPLTWSTYGAPQCFNVCILGQ